MLRASISIALVLLAVSPVLSTYSAVSIGFSDYDLLEGSQTNHTIHTHSHINLVFQNDNSSNNVLHDVDLEVKTSVQITLKADYDMQHIVANWSVGILYEENSKESNFSGLISAILMPHSISFRNNSTYWIFIVKGLDAGHVTLLVSCNPGADNTSTCNTTDAFVRFQVYHSKPLNVFSIVIGWIYFVAWSISFYPQAVLNFQRKSVVGLNFDFVALNLVGFLCYTAYNVGFFWIKEIQNEYYDVNPHDILPVELNDVIFAIHAVVLTLIGIIQIIIYEKGGQTISIVARVILSICALAIVIMAIIAAVPSAKTFNWLDMLYGFSYVKLGITIIKYMPQVYMNYKRRSTIGWSIGNVLLDFTGGVGSIVQMVVNAYNFNDWKSIFLNPVKFWLGALSIIFDIIFIIQHYVLYRNKIPYSSMDADQQDGEEIINSPSS